MTNTKTKTTTLSLNEKFASLILVSTSHGLPNAVRTTHPPMRCMWYTSVLVSTCVCSYLVILASFQYLGFIFLITNHFLINSLS